MYKLFSVLLTASLALSAAAPAAADSVSSHLATAQWLVGNYHCTNMSTLAGKAQKTTHSTFKVWRDGNWIDYQDPKGDPHGMGRMTWNKNQGKWVSVSTGTDGGYGVTLPTITSTTMTFPAHSVTSDMPDDANYSGSVTKTSAGFIFQAAGTNASGKNKGKAYTSKSVCTR